ncbi:reverse transcriptase domain-containing protein [Tanacetum coccineum]
MWENAKIVAPTPNSAIIQLDVDDNFVINNTHLNMIWENKFDGYLRADPHDHIREFLAICDMFKYGETQSEAVKLLIFPFSLCDEAKTWFNDLNEESITSWEQMRRAFINRFFPPSLFNHLLLEIRNFSQLVCENEPTQGIQDVTAGGIFLYKSPNQAFQFLEDKVLFNLDWSIKSKNEHHQKSVSFTDGSNSNNDNSRLMEKLAALTIKIDSQFISLKEELQDMCNKYNELREGNASKNHMNDDMPMCERHEANYIQFEDYQNQDSHNSFSRQSHYDPNDSEKSLTELNNDVRNDLEDFKRRIRSMRTVHWKLYDSDDRKTTGVLPNKNSKTVNQEPQAKTDFEKSITKFLDGQRVTNMFFKNNVNDMILKIKQNEKNFQTIFKNMERKMDEWSKSQNISLEQIDRTNPPPPQAHTEQVNAVFTGSGRSDDSPKTQKDPPPPIIVDNKIGKDKPIKTSKREYQVVKTNECPFLFLLEGTFDIQLENYEVHVCIKGKEDPDGFHSCHWNLEQQDMNLLMHDWYLKTEILLGINLHQDIILPRLRSIKGESTSGSEAYALRKLRVLGDQTYFQNPDYALWRSYENGNSCGTMPVPSSRNWNINRNKDDCASNDEEKRNSMYIE